MTFVNDRKNGKVMRKFKYQMAKALGVPNWRLRDRISSWTWNHYKLFLKSNGYIANNIVK